MKNTYHKQYSRQHYWRHKAQYMERGKQQRARGREYINKYLDEHPCVDCGQSNIDLLEFDHQSSKDYRISYLIGCPISTIQKEINKCEVRCGNCHRRKTLLQTNNIRSNSQKIDKRTSTGYSACRRQEVRKVTVAYVRNYLQTHPCVDCKENDSLVLEFDHVRDIKKYDISRMLMSGLCLKTIIKEIDKCEICCVNCHKLRTFSRPKQKYGASSAI